MSWSKVEEYKKRNKWKKPLLGIIGAAAFVMLASYTVKAEEIVDQDEEVISDTVGIVEDEGTSFIETEDTEETVETPERVEKPDAEAVEDNTEDLNSQVKEEENTIEKGWISENGSKYYLDEKGERCTGWLLQDEGWYYLDAEKDGAMFDAGWKYINSRWYYFNDNGVMKTGWLYYGEHWYYLSSYGDMSVDEWDYINSKWYYFYDSGVMETGWTYYKNRWYYLSPYGDMSVNEWDYINSKWYHFYDSGVMETGWTYYKNNWYYLSPYGDMSVNEWNYINSNWYHFDQNGIMQTGWFLYNGNWYYLYPANNNAGKSIGTMAQNTTIDGIYYIDSFGCMIQQQTLCQFLGIDGQYYYNFLKTHIADKTYIGTTYSNDGYKDGANGFSGWINSAGSGMNCEGFVDNVLKQCGASHPMSVPAGGKGWVSYNNHYGLPFYDYSSKADMLASGILEYGDIIWMFDTSGPNSISSIHHIGIFVGSNPYDDQLWHSLSAISNLYGTTINGNQVSKIVPAASGCKVWCVIKAGAIKTP